MAVATDEPNACELMARLDTVIAEKASLETEIVGLLEVRSLVKPTCVRNTRGACFGSTHC